MKKGIGPLAIGLIAILGVVVVGGIILTNFVFRLEFFARAARAASIIEKINEVEFVKRGLDKALIYSFHQASYAIASRGGYSDFDNVPSYNCISYWRNYTTINYPTDFLENIEEVSLKNLNDYTQTLSDDVTVPEYQKIERKEIEISCDSFDEDRYGCKNQAGCSWCGCGYFIEGIFSTCFPDKPQEECYGSWDTDITKSYGWVGCRGTPTADYVVIEATASDNLKYVSETLHIEDNASMNELIKTNISKLFEIGNENFVTQDKIGDAIENTVNSHDCDDSKSDVISSIYSKLSNLRTTLNSQYSTENIRFALSADSTRFSPSCNSTVAVRVLVKIKDTENKYPVYDYGAETTELRNIQLKFYVLSGNYIIRPTISTCE